MKYMLLIHQGDAARPRSARRRQRARGRRLGEPLRGGAAGDLRRVAGDQRDARRDGRLAAAAAGDGRDRDRGAAGGGVVSR
jgi:hypothetical protein